MVKMNTPNQPTNNTKPPVVKKKKKKTKSYKKMMAEITKSTKTNKEKIDEKRKALNTPAVSPPKIQVI